MNSKEVILTPDCYRRLEEELELLRTVKRKEIAERIKAALAFGDISENSEYDDAKQEQAFVEGRIKDLELLLANAQIIDDEDNQRGTVQVGSKVTIKEGDGAPETYMIVGPAEADPKRARISNESPFGRALLNHKKGDKVKVEAPGGAFTVQIVKIE